MKIYKQHDIKRIAGKLLTEDFNNNESFAFTNTSYGNRGEVFGTIESKKRNEEHTIQYALLSPNWNDKQPTKYTLVRRTYDRDWKNNTRKENDTLVQEFFNINRESYDYAVYCDDEEYARQASKIRSDRWTLREKKPTKRLYELDGEHDIKVGSKLYNELFTWIANGTGKPLKYGSEMSAYVYRYKDRVEYNWHDNIRKVGTELELQVRVLYRNKWVYLTKSKTFIPERIEKI